MKKLIGDEIQLKGSLWLGYYQLFISSVILLNCFGPNKTRIWLSNYPIAKLNNCQVVHWTVCE